MSSLQHRHLDCGIEFGGQVLPDRRTVAIEVGLQNGGMASGLAVTVLNSPDTALAPAIFGPWMNMSGPMLASWWRERLVAPSVATAAGASPTGAAG